MRHSGEPVWSGSFAVEGAALTRQRRWAGQPCGAADRHRARVPAPPLAARAGQRPASAVAGRVLDPARDRARRCRASPRRDDAEARVQAVTAGIVNLVPEGLILLISLTAAVSAFKMAQRGVLAQQLNAVESLASVDVVCTDKTGTLTEATLRVVGAGSGRGVDEDDAGAGGWRRYAASAPSRNLTLQAIADAELAEAEERPVAGRCRSRRGGAGARSTSATSGSCWGRRSASPTADPALVEQRGARGEATGRRVLALGRPSRRCRRPTQEPPFPDGRACARPRRAGRAAPAERRRDGRLLHRPASRAEGACPATRRPPWARSPATRACRDRRRRSTARRSRPSPRRCARQSCPRPPSGASRRTASGRSWTRSPTPGATWRWSATGSTTSPRSRRRASPSPRARGRRWRARSPTSCSCANDFGVVPGMVAEGRQILRNIQRVAQLFVTKSVFIAVVGLAVAIPTATFPLLPRQFTIASTVTIGIPAFVLALAPSSGPWRVGGLPAIGRPLRPPAGHCDRDRHHRRLPPRALRVRPRPRPLPHRRHRESWSSAASPS